MDINSLTSSYLNQLNINTDTSASAKKVKNLTEADLANKSDEELMDACKEFESYLLEQVMKSMEKTTTLFSDKEEGSDSAIVDYFMDTTIQELAGDVTNKQGLGIAQTLFEAMKRNNGL